MAKARSQQQILRITKNLQPQESLRHVVSAADGRQTNVARVPCNEISGSVTQPESIPALSSEGWVVSNAMPHPVFSSVAW